MSNNSKSRQLQPVAPLQPQETTGFYNMPDSPASHMMFGVLASGKKDIDTISFRKKQVSHGTKYEVRAYENQRQIAMNNRSGNVQVTIEVNDIYKTSVCPLARVMRRELKKRGIEKLKVVYSKEEPAKTKQFDEVTNKPVPASISFVPSVAGLIIAGEVIKDIIHGF